MKPKDTWEVWFRTMRGDTHKTFVTAENPMAYDEAVEYVLTKYAIDRSEIRELRAKFIPAL